MQPAGLPLVAGSLRCECLRDIYRHFLSPSARHCYLGHARHVLSHVEHESSVWNVMFRYRLRLPAFFGCQQFAGDGFVAPHHLHRRSLLRSQHALRRLLHHDGFPPSRYACVVVLASVYAVQRYLRERVLPCLVRYDVVCRAVVIHDVQSHQQSGRSEADAQLVVSASLLVVESVSEQHLDACLSRADHLRDVVCVVEDRAVVVAP